jgi:hypothetical protein
LSVYEYPEARRICYGEDNNLATFIPVCETCGRFVKPDKTIKITESGYGTLTKEPNATCSKCGRVQMLFEGFI